MDKSDESYTVGEIAKLAGISVRTLQYYDRCGLLSCGHTEGGRRLYGKKELIRLQQILFFKSYGFTLSEIRDRLTDARSGTELAKLLETQKDAVSAQIESLSKVKDELTRFTSEVCGLEKLTSEKLIALMELTRMNNPYRMVLRYLSESQVEEIFSRFGDNEASKQLMDRVGAVFSELIGLYRNGADPLGEEGQRLAGTLWQMSKDFSAGNPEMMKSLVTMGVDVQNWPDDVKELRGAVINFLSDAMYAYLTSRGISIDAALNPQTAE